MIFEQFFHQFFHLITFTYISLNKQFHCRSFQRTISREIPEAALGGARQWSNFFITVLKKCNICIYYIHIVCFRTPRECYDKDMLTTRLVAVREP